MELKPMSQDSISTFEGTFNRTLWNWNVRKDGSTPYITSTFNRTLWNWNRLKMRTHLLKWAFNRTLWNWNFFMSYYSGGGQLLLIVPYGIETCEIVGNIHDNPAFNRTLWNWNFTTNMRIIPCHWLLIVPYGIETTYVVLCAFGRMLF